ncbi:hypothetical protein Tco_0823631 [Tanacetum coccineum]|uniref:Uncharacterized protein n=1 Tax=Tanacetum coccineum TaxID=301880 RepID=A0ABQ5AL41_9ASTR
MDSTGVLKSVLKSSSTGGTDLASKVRNIEGNLRMPMRSVTFTKPLNDKVAAVNEASLGDIPHITKEKDPILAKEKLSFASVVNEQPLKKAVKIKELRNELSVNGAAVTIPIEAVEAVNASALEEDDSRTWDEDNGGTNNNAFHVVNDSDSEDVDEYITMEEGTKSVSQESSNDQGASTPLKVFPHD